MSNRKKVLRDHVKAIIVFFILCVLTLCFAAALPERYACAAEGASYANGSLNKDGKLKLAITVEKSELDEELQDGEAFKAYVNTIVKFINSSSKDNDMVVLKGIGESASSYKVSVATRRLNSNFAGLGDFGWSPLYKFIAPESDTYMRLALMAAGNLRCTLAKPFDGIAGQVQIEAGADKNEVYIKPVDVAANREITVEEFSAAGGAASKKHYITSFRIPDVRSISKVTVKLPGKVKFISSECVKVLSSDTVEIVPVTLKANVNRQEYVLDENGEPVKDASGVTVTRPVVERDKEISCLFGYVAYEHSPDYALIAVLCVLGAGLVVFVVLGFVKHWFAKFFGIAPKLKIQEQGEEDNEGTR
jgi:hypothetical protein